MNTNDTAPQTHLAGHGREQQPCLTCGTLFRPRRRWQAFCSTRCRNQHHAAEARKEQQREAAPELYEALLTARRLIRGNEVEHVWLNHPTVPEVTLGAMMDQALAKGGYREPKPEKPKP